MDGFLALTYVFGSGVQSIFGQTWVAVFTLLVLLVALGVFVGFDLMGIVAVSGLMVLGFGYAGWLPQTLAVVITMTIWGIGFGFYALKIYTGM